MAQFIWYITNHSHILYLSQVIIRKLANYTGLNNNIEGKNVRSHVDSYHEN